MRIEQRKVKSPLNECEVMTILLDFLKILLNNNNNNDNNTSNDDNNYTVTKQGTVVRILVGTRWSFKA